MRRNAGIWFVAASLLNAIPSSASEISNLDRFDLWNDCRPVRLVVESLPKAATTIGLNKDAIQTAIRSRLRAARIYSESPSETARSRLYVNVNVTRRAYSILFQYGKEVLDHATRLDALASTWQAGSIGMHGLNSDYILSDIARHTDKFIDEYLRVNRDACEKRPTAR